MKTVPAAAIAVFLSLTSVPALAQLQQRSPNLGEQSTVEIEVRRWQSDLVSELRLSTPGVPGTDLDPIIDLGLPNERTFDYHFGVRLTRRFKLRGNWFRIQYEADTLISQDLAIAGQQFSSGSILSSLLELEQRRGGVEFDIFGGEYGFLSVVGEWARFQATTELDSDEGAAMPERLRMDLPLLGLKGRMYLTPALAVTVEALGMQRESVGVMTDLDFSATYNAIPNLAFSYGYRNSYNRFKDIEPDSRAIFRVRGQYFSVTVRF